MDKEEIKKQLLEFIEKKKYIDDFNEEAIDVYELTKKIEGLFKEVKETKEDLHESSIELLRKYKKEHGEDYMIMRKGVLDDVFKIVSDLKEKIEFAGVSVGA